MKNICAETQNMLLSGSGLSPEMQKHLADCNECASMRSLLLRLNDLPTSGMEVPAGLDQKILAAAEAKCAQKQWHVWRTVLPLAASFAVCASILFMTNFKQPKRLPGPEKTVEIVSEVSDFEDNLFSMTCELGNNINEISSSMDLFI